MIIEIYYYIKNFYLSKINIKKHSKKYLDGAPRPAGLGADGDGLCLRN